jgi:hypothetical protein
MEGLNAADDFTGWLPIRVWQQGDSWRVDWCWFGDQALTQPFFNDDVERALRRPFNLAFRRETSLDALSQWQARSPGQAPSAFIYHASRCGSTLISQMLAGLDSRIVCSEPPPLDILLRSTDTAELSHAQGTEAIAGLLSAYGQQRDAQHRKLVIKLDAWSIFQLPLLRDCFPQTPWLFLYRDPLEIAVSHLRRPGLHMVPGLLGARDQAMPVDHSREDYIGQRLGRLLDAGLEHCRNYSGMALNYDELPAAMAGRLGELFGLTDEERHHSFANVDQHAKQPAQRFVADSEHKQLEATELLRESVQRWAQEPYRQLEMLRERQLQEF